MLKVGATIDGRYEILALIGEGGTGRVFKVQDLELNRVLAVKMLIPELSADAEWRERFLREGKTLSRIEHRNILKVFRLGLDQENPFLVTEFLIGKSVRDDLMLTTAMPWRRALEIVMQVCQGMQFAHQSGIVHRDLKPENIMVLTAEQELCVKVLDFGLARAGDGCSSQIQSLTQTGTVLGSVHYMSPEQCQGKAADHRSDVYALGCTLYECLSGAPPFDADNPIGLIHKHITAPIPLVGTLERNPETRALNAVLERALAKDPEQRYQSMSDFRIDLKCCLDGVAPVVATTRRSSSKAAWFQMLLGLALLSAVAVYAWWLNTDNGNAWVFVASRRNRDTRSFYEDAIVQADKLTQGGRPRATIALVDCVLGDRAGGVPPMVRAKILNCAAAAYLATGDKTKAKERAEGVIELLAPPYRHCVIDAGDGDTLKVALVSAKILQSCGSKYFFDSLDFAGSRGPELNHKVSRVELAMHRFRCATMEGADQAERLELDKILLEMERPFAEQTKDARSQAQFWLSCALSSKHCGDDFDLYGKRALELYGKEQDQLGLAQTFSALGSAGTARALEYLREADRLYREPPKAVLNQDGLMTYLRSVCVCATAEMEAGWNQEAASLCRLWIQRAGRDYKAMTVLLDPYVACAFEAGRSKEAETFLTKSSAILKAQRDFAPLLQYQRALALLQFRGGHYALAARTFERCISQMDCAVFDHPYKYQLFSDYGPLLDCYSILNEPEKFQSCQRSLVELLKSNRGSVAFILKMGSVQFKAVSEEIRKGDYVCAEQTLKDTLEKQPADWSNEAWIDLFMNNAAWHLAKIGDTSAAKRYEEQRKRVSVCELMKAPIITELLLGNYDKAEQQLASRLRRDQSMHDRREVAKDKMLSAITALLRGNPTGAKACFDSAMTQPPDSFYYPLFDLNDCVKRCFLCAEGKKVQAMRRNFTLNLAPTLENNLAYEYLLMADIARANNHADHVADYLRAARCELSTVLVPGHAALIKLDQRIRAAEPQ